MQQNTILGIDPGTKEMGIAIVRGTELLSFGVHTLRNGHRPHDVVGQARRIVLAAIEEHGPDVVAIEKPYMLPTKRAAILSVIEQELRGRAEDLGLRVVELTPEQIRQSVVGNPRATKIDVAVALVAGDFGQLAALVPQRPARVALGLRARDRYWMHRFDALGLAVAVGMMPNPWPEATETRGGTH